MLFQVRLLLRYQKNAPFPRKKYALDTYYIQHYIDPHPIQTHDFAQTKNGLHIYNLLDGVNS